MKTQIQYNKKTRLTLSILFILCFCIFSCTTQKNSEIDPYNPKRPADIPYTTCSGDTIDWDWKKQRAYNEKRLVIEKDSTGCVLMVIIRTK